MDAAVRVLQPLLFGALAGPQIAGPATPEEVTRVVRAWLAAGKPLGFARLSLGVEQIIENTRFGGETGDAAKALVAAYLREAQVFLAANEVTSVRLGQDGATCVYGVEGEGRRAELELAPTGVLTLRAFHADTAEAPRARSDSESSSSARRRRGERSARPRPRSSEAEARRLGRVPRIPAAATERPTEVGRKVDGQRGPRPRHASRATW